MQRGSVVVIIVFNSIWELEATQGTTTPSLRSAEDALVVATSTRGMVVVGVATISPQIEPKKKWSLKIGEPRRGEGAVASSVATTPSFEVANHPLIRGHWRSQWWLPILDEGW
ncbi:hypothetical protein CRG98_048332 [Punica granatum]|uniref:Uncharacterized protein n=1 Tax=Punica granatum TaxID=22663 RepID=A0A2I0HHS7_PUNGR|nr:hypothetical protein CRG98_048332 [Punica granatum]